MTKTSRALAFVVLSVALCSCAVTPQTRFSEFYERPTHAEKIDVVIDTLVLSDISGFDVGIDRAKNEDAMPFVEAAIKRAFSERGFKPNLVFHGNGTTFRKNEKTNYVYANGWAGTEEVYEGPTFGEQESMWGREEVQAFLHRLEDHAKDANKKQRKSNRSASKKKRELVPPLTAEEIPASIMAMPSNLFVLVKVSGTEVGKGKTIGMALATGVLTAALTGGMYVQASGPVSGSHIEVIVFDKSESRVVWHNAGQGQRYTEIAKGVDGVMKAFPAVTKSREIPAGSSSI